MAKPVAQSVTQPMPVRDIDIESGQPGSLIRSSRIVLRNRDECWDENRDECCDENRYENRFERGFEFKCVFESRFKGRFEYGFEYGFDRVFKCVYTQSENAVLELWEISCESTTSTARGCTCRWPTPVLLWKCKCRQRAFPHIASCCNECRQVETFRIVAIGVLRHEN